MTNQSVFVVGRDDLVRKMFRDTEGYSITDSIEDSTLVIFTGGEDVSPNLYGEKRLSLTHSNPTRDNQEIAILNQCVNKNKAGICRGGQFLNVMSGGKMYQDVDGHTAKHEAYNDADGSALGLVISTHHQMMIPSAIGEILVFATESSFRTREAGTFYGSFNDDTEVVWYPKTKSLCFQPHPEYGDQTTRDLFFHYLNTVVLKEKV